MKQSPSKSSDSYQINSTEDLSFSAIYKNYYLFTKKIVIKYESDSDTVLDILHDIMLKIDAKLPTFNNTAKISTWIYRLATNHCLDEIRRNKKTKTESLEGLENTLHYLDEHNEEHLEKIALINLLKSNLELLPVDNKNLLLKKHVQNLSIQEIMAETGLKSSAIKMRLKRSRERLHLTLISACA